MARYKKQPPGLGRPLQSVLPGGFDFPRITPKTARKQASRRRPMGPGERAVLRELARLDRHLRVIGGGRL